jgi:hypothetical protein
MTVISAQENQGDDMSETKETHPDFIDDKMLELRDRVYEMMGEEMFQELVDVFLKGKPLDLTDREAAAYMIGTTPGDNTEGLVAYAVAISVMTDGGGKDGKS